MPRACLSFPPRLNRDDQFPIATSHHGQAPLTGALYPLIRLILGFVDFIARTGACRIPVPESLSLPRSFVPPLGLCQGDIGIEMRGLYSSLTC